MQKKDGTTINTIIDAEDLKGVLEKGPWFAQWHKDFNNYLVQSKHEETVGGKKQIVKQTLQSFLMSVHTKAPIRHLNGDTLDNRRCNLELYKQDKVNDYTEFNKDTIAIILRDKYGKENGKTLIDKEDLERVIGTGYRWVCHKINKQPFAVANTPGGRIFLNRFVMQTVDNQITNAINLNTLDNRKVNLEHIVLEEDTPDSFHKKF
ncbi:MAG TPA: hypothetical protein VIO64_05665 [Pseudobacteroides sp.]|uniref:hypothetical protein n=1 Tax=Pseudobacteroides sp. TaxID=1968840 RepID=UPI002F930A3C